MRNCVFFIFNFIFLQNLEALSASLLNKNGRLEYVLTEYIDKYDAALRTAKAAKVEAALNRVRFIHFIVIFQNVMNHLFLMKY
jgi:hypothetical protein